MGLLETLMNKKDNSSFHITDEGISDSNSVQRAVQSVSEKSNAQTQQPVESDPIPNKFNYTPDQMDHLSKLGYSPEVLEKIMNANSLTDLYESIKSKPSAPDPKKMQNAQILAGVGDGFRLIGEMVAAGKGAHIRKRDYNDSSLKRVLDRQREENKLYQDQLDKYNEGLFQANMRDRMELLSSRKDMNNILLNKHKMEEATRQADAKIKFNYDKLKQDHEHKLANQQSLEKQREALIAQGWARVAATNDRTAAYVKQVSTYGKKNSNRYQMIFDAHPEDKNEVFADDFGNNVKIYEMSKGEIDRYARRALKDEGFMSRNPKLTLQKPDRSGRGTFKYAPNVDIAAAYIKEQYDNGIFKPSANTTSIPYQWDFSSSFNPQHSEYEDPEIEDEEAEDDIDEFPEVGYISNF